MRRSKASNARNDGRGFEEQMSKTCAAYFHARVMRLEKCEPPARILYKPGGRDVIFLENPFLDFVGTWTERSGRAVLIEAKSTSEPRLSLGGKLTDKQIEWLERWHLAGAAVGVVWEFVGQGARFLPVGQIVETFKMRKHVKWEEAEPIAQGRGFVLHDFAHNLRRWYP